ncbi:AcrR family transcriptional regulator [Nocardia transvalensis]|uniref:AcrR family transcriptional regulator n=1 Tax=Nocardia transvalensis TaxID=37333 RepID=A0A7W9PFN5_9NOCA|nr:TetR family transcriptional regulator [Nocardia transvalensis]MBB5915324.1 AcrR family transcriptional regulator [Nocardia transvalensis]
MPRPEPATVRGEETRRQIIDAALRLFEQNGYTKTTMRAIAGEAGVSVGNAYYYFASKEHLVQGFYQQIQALHQQRVEDTPRGDSLAARWQAMELAFVDVAAPYHEFGGKFFAIAAEPTSPLSPFSDESRPARETSTAIMCDLVVGADVKGDKRLLAELPNLLWLAHMGIVLFWVHDRSPGQERTRLLIRRVAPLVERVVALSRLRPLRPVLYPALDLIEDLGN